MTQIEQGRIRYLARVAGVALLAGLVAPAQAHGAGPGTIRGGNFSPGRPAALVYGPDPAFRCGGSIFSRLPGEVERQAKPEKVTPPKPDGALCAIADSFLGWTDPTAPRDGVLAFMSGHMGLVSPARQAFVTTLGTDDDVLISERLAETIVRHGKSFQNARYGAALFMIPREDRNSRPTFRVVLVLGEEPVALEPLPRRLALGQQAMLGGQLQGDLENPKVTISDARGLTSSPPQEPGKGFKAELRCGEKPGTIRVEISAEQAGSRRVVANFPVACGTDLPTTVPVAAAQWPTEVAAQERKVLEIINGERTAAGLPALVWDDAVAGVARSLSEGLSDESRRAAAGALVVEQLQKAGVGTPLLVVNPAQGVTVDDAQERLLTSPGHRANLMNPEVNHAGVGITTLTGKGGATSTFLAEVFVKILPPVDLVQVRKDLQAAIVARRAEGKVPEIPVDPALHEVAQKYAQEMAAAKGKLPEERDTQLLDSLKKTYQGVNMLAGASAAPLEFAKEKKVLSSGKALGVGLAQGDHPTLGRNTFYVVILFGEPREAAKPAKPAAKPPAKPKTATGK